jgi:hypothetical protein
MAPSGELRFEQASRVGSVLAQPAVFRRVKVAQHTVCFNKALRCGVSKDVRTCYNSRVEEKCAWQDSNLQPLGSKPSTLSVELQAQGAWSWATARRLDHLATLAMDRSCPGHAVALGLVGAAIVPTSRQA